MIIGFTGTQRGMSEQQLAAVDVLFGLISETESAPTLVQGDCIGADEQAYIIASAHTFATFSRPCTIENKRAYTECDVVFEPKDPIKRNHDIVDEADVMLVTPGEQLEVLRSGTWATIRYARKTETPLIVVYPDGSVVVRNARGQLKELLLQVACIV